MFSYLAIILSLFLSGSFFNSPFLSDLRKVRTYTPYTRKGVCMVSSACPNRQESDVKFSDEN